MRSKRLCLLAITSGLFLVVASSVQAQVGDEDMGYGEVEGDVGGEAGGEFGGDMAGGEVGGEMAGEEAGYAEVGGETVPEDDTGREMTGYADRSMTMGAGTLRIDVGPPDFAMLDSGWINNGRGLRIADMGDLDPADEIFVSLGIGAAYGITDQLEVGALAIPLMINPDFNYGNPEIYARYRFNNGPVEVGVQAAVLIPALSDEDAAAARQPSDFGVAAGVPVLVRIADIGRLDAGIEGEFIFADNTIVNLDVPVALNFDVADAVFIGARTGLFAFDITGETTPDGSAFDWASLQLGVQGGYTIVNGMADLTAWFLWPRFLAFGDAYDAAGIDTLNASDWQIGLGSNIYFDVM